MKNIKPHIAPIIIFLSSFFLRLSLIYKGPFHVDCLRLSQNAELTLSTLKLHYQFGTGYPLTVILGSIFIFFARSFGIDDPVIAVNFMSVFFSSACILILYYAVKKVFDPVTAVISSILLALDPIFMEISLYGKSHAPAMFFLSLGILLIIHFKDRPSTKLLALSAISLGFMGACRLQDLILMSLPLSFFVFFNKQSQPDNKHVNLLSGFRTLLFLWAIAFGIVLFFHLPLLMNSSSGGYSVQLSKFFSAGLFDNFDMSSTAHMKKALIFIYKSTNTLGIFLALFGLVYSFGKRINLYTFLLLWFLTPLLFYGNIYTISSRFLALIIPAFIIVQSYLLRRVFKLNILSKIVVVFFIFSIGLLPFMDVYPRLKFHNQNRLLPEYSQWLSSVIEDNAVVVATDESAFYVHFGNIKTTNRPLNIDPVRTKDMRLFKAKIDNYLDNNIPVYFTTLSLYSYDPDMLFLDFVLKNYKLRYIDKKITEIWHKGIFFNNPGNNILYRVERY
ncbi:MAG: glycosyltransferase family 39 protein [Candidatus Omnitrophica bacterium]|nr:glycosyltransferase family 39 protein [Candidatus Omnitrophota bacterium]MBU1997024.1 glycosyltransferase family 39 protein [Candidatus Omnitrophota bacterium]